MFDIGKFTGAGGGDLDWKVECDDMTADDWATAAMIVAKKIKFGAVEGVPNGGLLFAEALRPHITAGPLLIVDDVLTTGYSMEQWRKYRVAQGVVWYARGPCPLWIRPVWTLARWAE